MRSPTLSTFEDPSSASSPVLDRLGVATGPTPQVLGDAWALKTCLSRPDCPLRPIKGRVMGGRRTFWPRAPAFEG